MSKSNTVSIWRKVLWWIYNPALLVVLYFALVHEVQWCSNLTKFVIWLGFIISIITFLMSDTRILALREEGHPVPQWVTLGYNVPRIGALASFGWFGYAGMVMVMFIVQQFIYFTKEDD